ncbi:MAG: two-component system response regulator RstA [Paraglaciecola sp.]|jgi:two-component system response regulator RstA
MTKITLVEDDNKFSSLVKTYLEKHGFEIEIIEDGSLAPQSILSQQPDLIILDLMLPGKDGLTICREIRPHYKGKIIFLTASEDDIDHVAGVELGADDFIVKPIQPRVLLARIRMLLRRQEDVNGTSAQSQTSTVVERQSAKNLNFGKLSIYVSKRQVVLGEQQIMLTTSEFDLLALLANHAEKILPRDFIYKTLRGIEYDGMDRGVDTKIANLRKKLGDNASMSTRIITVRGQGYLFVPDSWDN